MEKWKPIPGYEGLYDVSDQGRVRSHYRGGRILQMTKTRNGYPSVSLHKAGRQTTKAVHRLVAEVFLGPSELHVNHKDGDKTNNRARNLEWCTHAENMTHRIEILGMRPGWLGMLGAANPSSKPYLITFPDGHTEEIIGLNNFCREHGLSQGSMAMIALGRSKSHKGFKCEPINKSGVDPA